MAPSRSALLLLPFLASAQLECKTFAEIYNDGTDLCQTMFGSSFTVVDNDTEGYTMWWFSETNPNDAVSQNLHPTGNTSFCNVQSFHKAFPTPEGDDFTECTPWKDASCCTAQTANRQGLLDMYGAEWRWNRCGTMSRECDAFMVQEACFYECSPHAGLYRRFGGHACDDANDPNCGAYDPTCDPYNPAYLGTAACAGTSHNTWEIYQMPIRKSYCDSWFDACRNDMFGANNNGSYFSWGGIPVATGAPTEAPTGAPTIEQKECNENKNNDNDNNQVSSAGLVGAAVVLAVLTVILGALVGYMCFKERKGEALFAPANMQRFEESKADRGNDSVISLDEQRPNKV